MDGRATQGWIRRRLAVAVAGAAALCAARSMAASPMPDAAEKAVAEGLRPLYAGALAKAGSDLKPGSPAFEASLARSASAFLAARPDDCGLDSWLAMSCGARSFDDPSSSMEPSIHRGDFFLALPIAGKRPIQRGDVLVFHVSRPPDAATDWVARVVGLPGDRVGLKGGILAIDGAAVGRVPAGAASADGDAPEPRSTETLPGGRSHAVLGSDDRPIGSEMEETTVPPGHYFVMGDNRPRALDSRYAASGEGAGLPALSDVVGRVSLIYVSKDPSQIGRSP